MTTKTLDIPDKEAFIILLLKQALIVYRLTEGLYQLGFDTDDYTLDIADMVFRLMGYAGDEQASRFTEIYCDFLASLKIPYLAKEEFTDNCARELYQRLKPSKTPPYKLQRQR